MTLAYHQVQCYGFMEVPYCCFVGYYTSQLNVVFILLCCCNDHCLVHRIFVVGTLAVGVDHILNCHLTEDMDQLVHQDVYMAFINLEHITITTAHHFYNFKGYYSTMPPNYLVDLFPYK